MMVPRGSAIPRETICYFRAADPAPGVASGSIYSGDLPAAGHLMNEGIAGCVVAGGVNSDAAQALPWHQS